MSHQDLEPLIIRGKAAPINQIHTTTHYERTKEQELEDEELGTHKKVPLSMSNIIQRGRIAKGFNRQRDLAIAIGVTTSVINAYESGRSIPDPFVLQKLRRVLGVKLK